MPETIDIVEASEALISATVQRYKELRENHVKDDEAVAMIADELQIEPAIVNEIIDAM